MKYIELKTIYADESQYYYADESSVWNIMVEKKDGVYDVTCFHWYDNQNPNRHDFIRNIYTCRAYSQADLVFKIVNHCLPAINRQRIIHGDEGFLWHGIKR